MNLKTSTSKAVERATIDYDNNVELQGVYGLCDVSQPLYYAIKNKTITDCNCFKSVFGFDCHFFYGLEQVKNNKTIQYERGIGHLEEKNGKLYLVRDIPIAMGDSPEKQVPCVGCTPFRCTDCEYLIAYSTVPQIYAENFLSDNYLITSIGPFTPHSFQVSENSLVGRLEGPLQSLSFSDKSFLDKLVSAIGTFTKQIILKTSKLDVKKLAATVLHIYPSSKGVAKRGTLIYDDSDNQFKYYDGNKWKVFVCQEDKE
jgi:hypothetical protein